jgi:hypothetical protein
MHACTHACFSNTHKNMCERALYPTTQCSKAPMDITQNPQTCESGNGLWEHNVRCWIDCKTRSFEKKHTTALRVKAPYSAQNQIRLSLFLPARVPIFWLCCVSHVDEGVDREGGQLFQCDRKNVRKKSPVPLSSKESALHLRSHGMWCNNHKS